MPRFAYRAKDHALQLVEGTVEAETEAAALSRLGQEGVFPISVVEVGNAPQASRRAFSRRISARTLAYVTRQLADLLGGGLPLLNALTLLARQTEQPALQRVVESLAGAVRDGRSFSEALAEHPSTFPSLYRSMIRAGEAGGGLEQSLVRLAELGEHEAELQSRIRSASAYPLFVLGVALAMTVFLMAYVIPKLSLVFLETGQALPLPTRLLLRVSELFTHWWWALFLVVIALAGLGRQWYAGSLGKAAIDRVLIGLPALGALTRKLETARFSRNVGTMVGEGVPLLQALDVAANNLANATLRLSVERVREAVQEGSSLAEALSTTGEFPLFVSNMVAVGEESGTMDTALLKVATTYEREVDRIIHTLTTILEPVLLVVVGGIVMFIVLAMLLPVFEIGLVMQ